MLPSVGGGSGGGGGNPGCVEGPGELSISVKQKRDGANNYRKKLGWSFGDGEELKKNKY